MTSQIKIISPPYNNERLKIPVSIVKGTNPNIIQVSNIGTVLNKIRSNDPVLIGKAEEIKALRNNDFAAYTKQKNKLEAFIIGQFSKRIEKGLETYVPLLVFDIDAIEDEVLCSFRLDDLTRDRFVFAVFPSPSFRGLRILVWCDSSPATHKTYYKAVGDHLAAVLGIKTDTVLTAEFKAEGLTNNEIKAKLKTVEHLDTSTKNISRHWYFTTVGENSFYQNIDSKVFMVQPQKPERVAKTVKKERPKKSQTIAIKTANDSLNISDKIKLLEAIQERRNKGGRNNNVFEKACLLWEYGLNKQEITSYCGQFKEEFGSEPFPEKEVEKAVNSAYKNVSEKGGIAKYNDNQLFSYGNKILGYQMVNSILNRSLPPKSSVKTKTINETTNEVQPVKNGNEGGNKKLLSKYEKLERYLNERYIFRYNTLSNEAEYKGINGDSFEPLNENDLLRELLKYGFKSIKTYFELLMGSNFIPRYEPINNYCENLPNWTLNDPDYITQLANYIRAKDQYWFNSQFKKMLVRTLACGLGHIPFNKQCFTMYGKQNDGKTTFLRFLCPPALDNFYSEDIDFQSKDGRIALATNFIINLDELDSLQRKEITSVKKFMSTSKIKARPPFGKRAISMTRRVSFFATTNEGEFLTDTTGNVRWLVMEVESIQHDNGGKKGYNHNINIDMVWAQAYALLKMGFPYKITSNEIAKSELNNRSHQVQTIEMDFIQQYFIPSDATKGVFLTTGLISNELQGKTISKLSSRKIGQGLRYLGFKQSSKRIEGNKYPIKGYWVTKIKPDE